MKEIVSGIYVETRYKSGNVGLVLTGAGAICIDVPTMPNDVEHWLAQIRRVTQEPIVFSIQTDYSRDRVVSTCLIDAPIIAHEATWEKMKVYRNDKKTQQIREMLNGTAASESWEARLPDITFTERLILNKGTREIYIMHGGGHSAATSMVYLHEERLIFTGDLVYNKMHPSMVHAHTKEWLSSLNQLRKMVADTVVPGHGEICDKEATYLLSDYIREMRAKVRQCFQTGRSKSETSSILIPEFIDVFPHAESERDRVRRYIKGGCDRIYDEFRAATKASATANRSADPSQARNRKYTDDNGELLLAIDE